MTRKIGIYRDARKTRPYIVRWFGLPDITTGKRKRYSKAFKTEAEAQQFQAKQLLAFADGRPRDEASEVMLKQLCNDWLQIKKANGSPGTVAEYRTTAERLIRYFGADRAIRKITLSSADTFIAELKPVDGGELANWTRLKILRNCKAVFNKAVKWKWISENPFNGADRPKCEPSEWRYIEPAEYTKLLDVLPSVRWQAAYALAYTAGLRFAEAFNLTWDNVDFEQGEVRIRNRKGTADMPPFKTKTKHSVRTIPLTAGTLSILSKLRQKTAFSKVPIVLLTKRQYDNALARWRKCSEKNWESKWIVYNVPREVRRHYRNAGIKPRNGEKLSFHTLRKCAGKNFADLVKNPKTTQRILGHAQLSTTMEFYNRVSEDDKKKAVDAVGDLLRQTDAKVTPTANTA